jgi:hypothetical protein
MLPVDMSRKLVAGEFKSEFLNPREVRMIESAASGYELKNGGWGIYSQRFETLKGQNDRECCQRI